MGVVTERFNDLRKVRSTSVVTSSLRALRERESPPRVFVRRRRSGAGALREDSLLRGRPYGPGDLDDVVVGRRLRGTGVRAFVVLLEGTVVPRRGAGVPLLLLLPVSWRVRVLGVALARHVGKAKQQDQQGGDHQGHQ
ncbi:hypothetical protein MTO96_024083 [Rhipicephalus appendiculatus]